MIEKECPACTIIFTPKRSDQKFCSKECQKKGSPSRTHKPKTEKVCEFCEMVFVSGNDKTRFCKRACKIKAAHKRTYVPSKEEHECENCNIKYLGAKNSRFCSKECADKHGYTYHNPIEEKICPTCETIFSTTDSKKKYCTDDCRRNFTKVEPEERNCKNCNSMFITSHQSKQFCSDECKTAYTSPTVEEKPCKHCNKIFDAKYPRTVYCSDECQQAELSPIHENTCITCNNKFKTKYVKEKWCSEECEISYKDSKKVKPDIEKICKNCEIIYYTKSKKSLFCCGKCRNEWNRTKGPYAYKPKERIDHNCAECNILFKSNRVNAKFCSEECSQKYRIREMQQIRIANILENYENVPQCLICGMQGLMLTSHLDQVHNMSTEEYKEKFNVDNSAIYHESYIKFCSDKIKGDQNPAYGHDGKFSPYSEKFIKYDGLDDKTKSDKITEVAIKTSNTRTSNHNDSTQLEYYIKRGASHDEATQLLAERQNTFTLEKCIRKYGSEEGTKIYNDRQIDWINSLYNKSDEELLDIKRRKTSGFAGSSNIARDLFKRLQDAFIDRKFIFDDLENDMIEVAIYNPNINKRYEIDFIDDNTKHIIEFFGDFFHGLPELYEAEDICRVNGKSYAEIWERDKIRLEYCKSIGYKVLVVWESDYKYKRDATIEKCINFLNS